MLLSEEGSNALAALPRWSPSLWRALCRRFPDAEALARYANGAALGRGRARGNVTAQMITDALARLDPGRRAAAVKSIRGIISAAAANRVPIPAHDVLRAALRGDSAGDRLHVSANLMTIRRARLAGHIKSPTPGKAISDARRRQA